MLVSSVTCHRYGMTTWSHGWPLGRRTYRVRTSTSCWTLPAVWKVRKIGRSTRRRGSCTQSSIEWEPITRTTGRARRCGWGSEPWPSTLLVRTAELSRDSSLIPMEFFGFPVSSCRQAGAESWQWEGLRRAGWHSRLLFATLRAHHSPRREGWKGVRCRVWFPGQRFD